MVDGSWGMEDGGTWPSIKMHPSESRNGNDSAASHLPLSLILSSGGERNAPRSPPSRFSDFDFRSAPLKSVTSGVHGKKTGRIWSDLVGSPGNWAGGGGSGAMVDG
jgi:hypothetical protein